MLACAVADAGREAVEIEMPLAVYLGRLDPNYVAARWRTVTAAGAQSGVTPLGSAPRAPQMDAPLEPRCDGDTDSHPNRTEPRTHA